MADLVVASLTGGQVEKFIPADRFTATATATILGGQVVELVTGGERRVQPAGAASNAAIGVAMYDAANGASLTVATEGVWLLTASGSITAGNRVICAAAGAVAAAGGTPDARQIIGIALADATNGNPVPVKLGGAL